jgi:hypothetical protein
MSGGTTGNTQQARAKLCGQLEDAAREVVRLLEEVIDRRVIERSSVTRTGRVDMERTERGTIGYQALRAHLRMRSSSCCAAPIRGHARASRATKRRRAVLPVALVVIGSDRKNTKPKTVIIRV